MTLNCDLPNHFYCKLKKEFLYDQREHKGEFVDALVFAISSIPGRAIGFSLVTEHGAQFSRLPIQALVHKEKHTDYPLNLLQPWDAMGYEVVVNEYKYLREMPCKVMFRDKSWHPGRYMFTIDFLDNGFSAEPTQAKCYHMIKLCGGQFSLQPNNRIIWLDSSFVKPLEGRPDYIVNSHVWHCE